VSAAILLLIRGNYMKKISCVLAILAAVSTAAVAGELKQEKKATTPAVAATQMTDAEMDRVTAGVGYGLATAEAARDIAVGVLVGTPGYGVCTTGASGYCLPSIR
jgi:NAD/NADP transhydrogenase beta subunit